MKEIGGYFELEHFEGEDYYPDLVHLNLGRTALLYVLKSVHTSTLWMPYFICSSVKDTCLKAGYKLKYYHVDENFMPVIEDPIPFGEFLYLVNYYGQLDDATVLSIRKKHTRVILDDTQSFFQPPFPWMQSIYSLRKYFGVSDGAYAYLGGVTPCIDTDFLEEDSSADRMSHLLGRFEHSASEHYEEMLQTAGSFDTEMVKKMSPLTENIMKAIDFEQVKTRREANYKVLDSLLGEQNPLPIHMPAGPFCYPFYHKEGAKLRRLLAEEKIYVPVYWKNVIEEMPEDSLEYDYASNILALPCDHRYTPEDMELVAEAVKEAVSQL